MNLLLERNTEELKQDIIIFNLNTSHSHLAIITLTWKHSKVARLSKTVLA